MSRSFSPQHPQSLPALSLQELMQRVGFSTFRALSRATGISEKQIRLLRRGEIAHMRLETLIKLSRALKLSVTELLVAFAVVEAESAESNTQNSKPTQDLAQDLTQDLAQDLANLQQEYDRLQAQLAQQQQDLQQEFQQTSLQVLESLLLQLPTAAFAAQQNPQVPAVKLLPLLKPIDSLLQAWGIEAIAPVASELAYDPQQHQLMEGHAKAGDLVRVRYTGYRQGSKLLYRAKVSPVV